MAENKLNTPPILELCHRSFWYPEQEKAALRNLSLTVAEGAFLVICGPSGCGKSTLLRQLKPTLTPSGKGSGDIRFKGVPIWDIEPVSLCRDIGFVQQSPENQLVTDKVWHELAFGLESLGYDTPTVRRQVAEIATFFGIQGLFHHRVYDLSGGQKQLLNLASVVVMQPKLLILDEPTSQLDPIAASEFLDMLYKLNRELGITVILTEHRLEEALSMAHQVVAMDDGEIISQGTPQEVGQQLKKLRHPMFRAMPTPMRVWAWVDGQENCPISVGEGRRWLGKQTQLTPVPQPPSIPISMETVVSIKDVWFRYAKDGSEIVKGLSLSVKRGEVMAILGGNGTGKSTTLRLIANLQSPQRGSLTVGGRVRMLPQNPQALFVKNRVEDELYDAFSGEEIPREVAQERVGNLMAQYGLEPLLNRHPYDLSGGEQQLVALCKVLLLHTDILLLDEPTKGLDGQWKEKLGGMLQGLSREGITVIVVSHDVEFCASYATQCALFFDGGIVARGAPTTFFTGNHFYTTAANRMSRDILDGVIFPAQLITACGGVEEDLDNRPNTPPTLASETRPTPSLSSETPSQKRNILSLVTAMVFLLMIPLTLYVGITYLEGTRYYFIALLVLFECMIPFFLSFEGRDPQPRELVTIAVLCAIAVAGRAIFFMIPQFKPVIAICIIAGVVLGSEVGFLVGAMSMLASNVLFSQGPWTPWQMFAMGLIGCLAGILFRPGGLPQKKIPMALFGGLSAIILYGGIMNTSSMLLWSTEWSLPLLLSYCVTGFPMDLVHGLATGIFLWIIGEPMIEKLERVKKKYGLLN